MQWVAVSSSEYLWVSVLCPLNNSWSPKQHDRSQKLPTAIFGLGHLLHWASAEAQRNWSVKFTLCHPKAKPLSRLPSAQSDISHHWYSLTLRDYWGDFALWSLRSIMTAHLKNFSARLISVAQPPRPLVSEWQIEPIERWRYLKHVGNYPSEPGSTTDKPWINHRKNMEKPWKSNRDNHGNHR